MSPVDKIAIVFASIEIQREEYKLHVQRRDRALTTIYNKLANRDIPEGRQKWFHCMSEVNNIFDKGVSKYLEISQCIKEKMDPFKRADESVDVCLDRLPAADRAKMAEAILEHIKVLMQEARDFVQVLGLAVNYDARKRMNESLDIRRVAEAADVHNVYDVRNVRYIVHAFQVLLEVQPRFEQNDLYIMQLSVPDIVAIVWRMELGD